MTPPLMALASLALGAATPIPSPAPSPGATPAGPQAEGPDPQSILLGRTDAQAILAHRAVFRDNFAKVKLPAKLRARWKAVKRPLTLVAVFGSWCGDSHAYLPDLLALDSDPNPFIEVHYAGVDRDKALDPAVWPEGCPARKILKVPTFFLFATGPGGQQKLAGVIMEDPPRPHQTMAEALVELAEQADRR